MHSKKKKARSPRNYAHLLVVPGQLSDEGLGLRIIPTSCIDRPCLSPTLTCSRVCQNCIFYIYEGANCSSQGYAQCRLQKAPLTPGLHEITSQGGTVHYQPPALFLLFVHVLQAHYGNINFVTQVEIHFSQEIASQAT